METKLWTLSRETYSASLAATTHHIQALFHSRSKRFDGKLAADQTHLRSSQLRSKAS
jgi:hypothetical protein